MTRLGSHMSAREIIAQALEDGNFVDVDFSIDDASAAEAILEALAAAGYRILAPGELDKETLEAAAKVAAGGAGVIRKTDADTSVWDVRESLRDVASRIRSLTVDGEKP